MSVTQPSSHPDSPLARATTDDAEVSSTGRHDDQSSRAERNGLWPLSKMQAFSLHAALSILIFSSLVAVMLIWWFPGKLFIVDGGWEGLKLVAMVDLVLGPALTLLLYKPGKPKLVMDMSMIAALQIAALAYGFYTTHQQRTVAVVHADGAFSTLSAAALKDADNELRARDIIPEPLSRFASGHPRILMNPPPADREAFGKYLEDIMNGYPQAHERSDQLIELTGKLDVLDDSAKSLDELDSDEMRKAVADAIESTGKPLESLQLHDFKARYGNGIAIFDPESSTILDYVSHTASEASEIADSE